MFNKVIMFYKVKDGMFNKVIMFYKVKDVVFLIKSKLNGVITFHKVL